MAPSAIWVVDRRGGRGAAGLDRGVAWACPTPVRAECAAEGHRLEVAAGSLLLSVPLACARRPGCSQGPARPGSPWRPERLRRAAAPRLPAGSRPRAADTRDRCLRGPSQPRRWAASLRVGLERGGRAVRALPRYRSASSLGAVAATTVQRARHAQVGRRGVRDVACQPPWPCWLRPAPVAWAAGLPWPAAACGGAGGPRLGRGLHRRRAGWAVGGLSAGVAAGVARVAGDAVGAERSRVSASRVWAERRSRRGCHAGRGRGRSPSGSSRLPSCQW